jgi:nucleotide-binding universal stress UspA family protein
MFNKILVCSDGSEHALAAAQAAAEIARRFHSQVLLLTVFDPEAMLATGALTVGAVISTETVNHWAKEIQEKIIDSTGKIFEEKAVTYTVRCDQGHPVDVIVKVAASEQVDLIVLGHRGLGGFQRLLLGSVSEGVLHHAHCPVLLVR